MTIDELNEEVRKAWELDSIAGRRAQELTVLALCVYVRDALPRATHIHLEASDQEFSGMRLFLVEVDQREKVVLVDADDVEALDEDTLWSYCSSLDADPWTQPWQVAGWEPSPSAPHGSVVGRLDISAVLGALSGKFDPMPDPNDLPAVEAWLEERKTQ